MKVKVTRITTAQFARMLVEDAKRLRHINHVSKPRCLEDVEFLTGINRQYLRELEQGKRPATLRQAALIHRVTSA